MKGLLKSKSPGSQLLLLVGICIFSLFIFSLIGTIILAKMTGMKLTELSDMSKWDYSKPEIIFLIRGMQVVQFIGLFVIPVFVCSRLFSTDAGKYLGFKKPSNNLYYVVAIAIMIVAIPLVNWLGELNKNVQFPDDIEGWMKRSEEEAAKTVQALLSKHTIKDLVLNIICIAGLAAVGEELLFRGMVQRLFIKMFRTPWPGIIITAFLFSAMHMQFYGFLPRFALGILLGAIYWYSGSLWTAILAHFVYDGLLIVLVYFNPEMLKEEQSVTATNIALIGSISFAGVVLLIEWMRKKTTTTYAEVYADDNKPVKDHPFDFE
jgi:uncharacterized protein